ncbi:chorismate-binding protein [Mobiluncus curtisii]|uniref:chorismate-binding protein n=1 Tax=Mobiluncus curtisii TaxID=2051 RepID=UPI00146FD5AA|nr:isochorismate synthase [Mobiluncus curtisii]NMW99413.1 isochorismate synthase [Mobiluncus curtisii]NMX05333.1 isochorismate synthase [Mobiluncus curtisii]
MLFVHTRALDRDLSPELLPMDPAALPTDGFFFASPPAQGAPLTLAAPGLGDIPGQDFAPAWHWEDGSDLDRAGAAWYLVGRHAQVFDAVQRRGTGPVAFASFGFNSAATPVFVLPSFLVGSDAQGAWITVAYQAESVNEPRADRLYRAAMAWIKNFPHRQRKDALQTQPSAVVGKTSYQENVAAAVRAIREGKAEKIVMARPARFEFAGEAGAERARAAGGALASRLRERYPTCWIFNVGGLVGATPEMLLDAAAGRAHSRVLAGTATPGEDVDLAHSAKNLAEHQVALRSVAEPLRRVDPDLEASGPYLLQLPNLTHLATDLHLRVPAGKTLLHLVAQFHPTAAVCGLPREFARTFISRFEADRGRYAGPVGWVDAQGGGQLALALRCAQLDALGVEAWVGAGIMADSDPETEWRETGAKLAPIRDCLNLSAD